MAMKENTELIRQLINIANNLPENTIPDGYVLPQGTLDITENGEKTVTTYDKVNVNVPIPTFTTEEKTVNPTEGLQEVTPTSADGLSKVTVNPISSTYVGSAIPRKSSTDVTVSGATVTTPVGYYGTQVQKSVASGTAGTPSASKGSVANHSVTITPTVTNTTGYITGGTKTGTGVNVSASELVSGSETKVENGSYDVTNLKTLIVNVPQLDTSDANATTGDIVVGKSAYVNGEKVDGNISDYRDLNFYASLKDIEEATIGFQKRGIRIHGSTTVYDNGLVLNNETDIGIDCEFSEFGTVQPESVLAGETFTSSAGLKREGTLVVQKYYTGSTQPSGMQDGDLWLKV